MKAIKLSFDEINVEFFSKCFLAPDHHSDDHGFMGLYKVLSEWSVGSYHVYCSLDDDDCPMGICHGRAMNGVFFGHIYFIKEFRGKKAMWGFEHCVSLAIKNLGISKLVTHILPDNKPAQMFASLMGFEKVDERKYICDLKESA